MNWYGLLKHTILFLVFSRLPSTNLTRSIVEYFVSNFLKRKIRQGHTEVSRLIRTDSTKSIKWVSENYPSIINYNNMPHLNQCICCIPLIGSDFYISRTIKTCTFEYLQRNKLCKYQEAWITFLSEIMV